MAGVDTIASAYAESPEPAVSYRERRLAQTFEVDPERERLLTMRAEDPERFDSLPVTVRMAVGSYENQKRAAEAVAAEDDAKAQQ